MRQPRDGNLVMSDIPPLGPDVQFHSGKPIEPEIVQQILESALNPHIPRVYANGTIVGLTATDLVITGMFNNAPANMTILPLSVAKGLGADITIAVAEYERTTGQTVMTLGEIGLAVQSIASRDRAPKA